MKQMIGLAVLVSLGTLMISACSLANQSRISYTLKSTVEDGRAVFVGVDGPQAPDIYSGTPQPGSGH